MTGKQKSTDSIATEIAKVIVPRPELVPEGDEVKMVAVRQRHRHNIEQAIRAISFALERERREAKAVCYEECAVVAEGEFSQQEKWNRPVFSAKGAGDWIATSIRSRLTGNIKTNIIYTRKKGKLVIPREMKDDPGSVESDEHQPGAAGANHKKAGTKKPRGRSKQPAVSEETEGE
jgi:hypothetical protein